MFVHSVLFKSRFFIRTFLALCTICNCVILLAPVLVHLVYRASPHQYYTLCKCFVLVHRPLAATDIYIHAASPSISSTVRMRSFSPYLTGSTTASTAPLEAASRDGSSPEYTSQTTWYILFKPWNSYCSKKLEQSLNT